MSHVQNNQQEQLPWNDEFMFNVMFYERLFLLSRRFRFLTCHMSSVRFVSVSHLSIPDSDPPLWLQFSLLMFPLKEFKFFLTRAEFRHSDGETQLF